MFVWRDRHGIANLNFRSLETGKGCFRSLEPGKSPYGYGASIDVVMKIIDVGGKQMVIDRDFSFGIKFVFIM